MTAKNAPMSRPLRRLLAAQVLGVYLAATMVPSPGFAAPTVPPASLAQVPQFLPTPPAPNLVVTLDDSGSMTQAFAPDEMYVDAGTRRFKSAAFNPLYYDPNVVYAPPVDANGVALPTSFSSAWINGFDPTRGEVDLRSGYRPTMEYVPSATTQIFAAHAAADLAALGIGSQNDPSAAYYYRFNPSLSGCDGTTGDDDCYQLVIVSATSGTNPAVGPDERQNFANWYSFYRTRNLLTVTAASRALAGLPPSVRIAWQGLTTCASFGTSCQGWDAVSRDNRIRPFEGAHRDNFYSWLFRLPAQGYTPLRSAMMRAGDYYRTSGVNSPYAQEPQIAVGTEYSCRPNYHLMMTDGLWNSNADTTSNFCAGAACGNQDGSAASLPDGSTFPGNSDSSHTAYAATRVYRDANSDSLADVAFYYWRTDLRSDLENNVAPYLADSTGDAAQRYWNPKNDPATWQHMVNFTVGLGMSSFLNQSGLVWGGSTHAGSGYDNLRSGVSTWPATGSFVSPGNVYDLWHAAINSRGLAFSADRPADLLDGFRRIVREISRSRAVVGAAAATSTAYLDTGNGIFTAEFGQGTWAGNLYRREIDPVTLRFRATDSSGNPLPRDSNDQPYVWRASDALPAPSDRRIFTMHYGSSPRSTVVPFTAAALDSSQLADLNAPQGPAADVIAYLRGDRDKELSASPPGNFRDRPRPQPGVAGSYNNPLGTIANSAPVYVKALDWGYDFLPVSTSTAITGRETYLGYLRANQGNSSNVGRAGMLWTGSNGGMFHAFDAQTGQERFAYVPRSVIRNLPLLVDPEYTHRYMVDGVPAQGDAYLGSSCPNLDANGVDRCWRTVVVSSLGAGGRAVFAIDATDPSNLDADSVLWELDETSLSSSAYERLGHVLGPAIVARVKDNTRPSGGRWVAVFGNGPESDEKTAALFVVDLETGSVVRVLDTRNGNASNPNGLSTPAPLFDANRQLIAVYAGDLRGNLWKFDLSGPNPDAWEIAFRGEPLFRTRSPANIGPAATRDRPQPIFAKPLLRLHPDGGVMVVFGTGRLFSPGDREAEDVQTVYGIWDKPNESSGLSGNFRAAGSALVQQAIIERSGDPSTYFMTNLGVSYNAGRRGWYFDLGVAYSVTGTTVDSSNPTHVTPRERVIAAPAVLGQNLLVQTFVPAVDPCDAAGLSFLFRLNVLTGSFVGDGSFGSARSAAIAMPGSFGLSVFVDRLPQGADPRNRTGVAFGVGLAGDGQGSRMELGGFGAFRTWRQLLD